MPFSAASICHDFAWPLVRPMQGSSLFDTYAGLIGVDYIATAIAVLHLIAHGN